MENKQLPADVLEPKWKLILHDGVEDPYYELTNGPISLCAPCGFVGETEEGEDAIFKCVADALNHSGIDFHSENKLELEQHIKIMELQYEVDYLKDYIEAHPGIGWVKASEFKTHEQVYRPYRKKTFDIDEGEYDYGEIYVTEDDGRIYLDVDNECNYDHQSDERWKDYEILDESGTAAAGREDTVEFAEWAIRNATVTSTYDGWIYGSKRYSTAQLYELFKAVPGRKEVPNG